MRKVVVLPQPLGPSSATDSPFSTASVTSADRDGVAVAFFEAGNSR